MNPVSLALIRLSYPPSLILNRLMCGIGVWNHWDWIDDKVLLGAVPARRHIPRLHELGIRSIVNLCEEFRGHLNEMSRLGITHLHLPTFDYTAPSKDAVQRGVRFLLEETAADRKCYVHCKAGQSRSATLALCYLMTARGLSTSEAFDRIQQARPNVNRRIHRRAVVRAFEPEARQSFAHPVEAARPESRFLIHRFGTRD